MNVLSICNLSKSFGEQKIIKNLNLSVPEGSVFGFIGQNGAGKTTLMNIVGCLDQATSGRLILDGQDISKCSDNQMSDIRLQKIGFVFQNFNLFPHMTVMENLTLAQTKVRKTSMEEAKKIAANGIKYYIEVANMPTTNEALRFLMDQKNMVVAPSKAVNAGGVLVSGLEMSQNSERYSWTAEEVDSKLHQIMTGIHDGSAAAAEKYGLGYNLVAGANIVGFQKVADAMMAQGICW